MIIAGVIGGVIGGIFAILGFMIGDWFSILGIIAAGIAGLGYVIILPATNFQGTLVKVIIEACLLTDEEKVKACELSVEAGADFVKTSTGFSTGGATAADIALMRKTVGPELGVKASGGVRSLEDMKLMIENGATRIGASSGVAIMNGLTSESNY